MTSLANFCSCFFCRQRILKFILVFYIAGNSLCGYISSVLSHLIFKDFSQFGDNLQIVCLYLLFKRTSMKISIFSFNLSALKLLYLRTFLTSSWQFMSCTVLYLASNNKQFASSPVFSSQSLQFLPFSVPLWPQGICLGSSWHWLYQT